MKILHITPSSNGYEEVELLANHYSETNQLAVIKLPNGDLNMTGGYLLNDTPEIRKILDGIEKSKQYAFVKAFKETPFEKSYFEDEL